MYTVGATKLISEWVEILMSACPPDAGYAALMHARTDPEFLIDLVRAIQVVNDPRSFPYYLTIADSLIRYNTGFYICTSTRAPELYE